MRLVQVVNGKEVVHGVAGKTSELIAHYYKYRKHFGYMEVKDGNNVLATLGSK